MNVKYRIYQVDEKGMLERPKESGYGGDYNRYDDFISMQAAWEGIENWREYVVLPVMFKSEI